MASSIGGEHWSNAGAITYDLVELISKNHRDNDAIILTLVATKPCRKIELYYLAFDEERTDVVNQIDCLPHKCDV